MITRESEARARESDREAREVVGRIVTETAERLEFVPHGQKIRHDMLQQAVEFYNRFLEQRGDDPELRHESALAWLRVGNIQRNMGNTNEASTAYDEAIRKLSELVTRNPSVTSYRADLARSHYRQAFGLSCPEHRPQDAVVSARRAVDLYEQLVRSHPNNRKYCSLYAGACAQLGMGLDRFTEAERAFRQALRAWSKLPGEAPETPAELCEKAGTLLKYGGFLRKNYRFLEAEKSMRKALGLLERALNQSPTDFALRRSGVVEANRSLGKLLATTGRLREAERHYRTAVEIREMKMDQYPSVQIVRFGLAMCLRDLSDVLLAIERVAEAEAALRRSLALSRHVTKTISLNREYEIELGTVHYRLGCLLHHTNRQEEAAAEFTKAQQLLESYADTFPDLASAPRRLVTLLATCPDETFRDPGRAVERARTPVERAPENGRWWHLQGVAQYSAGHYHDAARSFARSMELRAGGNSFDRLLLAMTYWHLAEKEEAREWYARAVDFIDNRGWRVTMDFTSLDLERFRSEAKELLGVSRDKKAEHDEKQSVDH